jgi:tetratricopeptide (TPR) repeat protein
MLNKKSIDIYKNTRGNPIIVKFAVFTEGLRKDVDDRYDKYIRDPSSRLPDSFKIQTTIVCSLLDIAGITITDTLLESMNLKEHARLLKDAVLYHQDRVWKTIHPRWDLEFLSYLYGEELDEDELEERLNKNRPYLEDALKSIFLIKDGKISVSVIQVLFDTTAIFTDNFQKIPIDFIDDIVQIPEYVDSHTQSILYSSTIASNYFKLKQYTDALEKCQKAIELDSEYVNAWHNKGVVLYNLERYEEAISYLHKAIELDSNDTYSWYNLADVYGSQGNVYYSQGNHDKAVEYHDKAVEFYNKAIEIDPKHAAAWLKKGISLSMLGKYESSIECYDKAIKFDSTDVKLVSRGHFGKSISLGQLGKYSEATESYNKAIALDPSVETESSQ